MKGKILKISSNDLYGNTDDRLVAVYACFTQKKYMNKYIISFIDGNGHIFFQRHFFPGLGRVSMHECQHP